MRRTAAEALLLAILALGLGALRTRTAHAQATLHGVVTAQPGGAVGGVPFAAQPAFTIKDIANATVTGATNAVTVSIQAGTGTVDAHLSGTITVNAVAGVATFTNLSIDKAGTGYVLLATSNGIATVSTAPFNVTPGAPAQLQFVTQPGLASSGGATLRRSPVVRIADAVGNTVTSGSNAVALSIKGGSGANGANLLGTTSVNAVNGVATFANVRIDRPALAYVLTASAAGLASMDSAPFDVSVGPAAKVVVVTPPGGASGGALLSTQPVFALQDGDGNPVVEQRAVSVAIKNGTGTPGAVLSGKTTVTAVRGIATFANLSIDTAGTAYVLTASGSGLTPVDAAPIDITVGTGVRLRFRTSPAGATTGGAIFATQPLVSVVDAGGNTVTSATPAITVGILSGTGVSGATLLGTTSTNAVAGSAQFTDLRIAVPGVKYRLVASAPGVSPVFSTPFDVTQGPAATIAVSRQPAGATSGLAFLTQPTVLLRDGDGRAVLAPATVTATIKNGTGTPGAVLGLTTAVGAHNGTATFTNLRIDRPGTGYVITFTAGALSVDSAPFDVALGTGRRLVVQTQLVGAQAGTPLATQPVFAIHDDTGGVRTATAAPISVAIKPGTGALGAHLTGTTTVTPVNGVIAFTDLAIDLPGTGYEIVATASGLLVTTTPFDVTP